MNILNEDIVTVTDMNTIIEIRKSLINYIPKPTVKRIDKNHYVDTETGEVKEYKPKDKEKSSRKNNPKSLARTGRNNKNMMICNFEDKRKTQYITLTYDDNVFDYKQSYNDFKAFIKTIRRNYCSDNDVKYFVVQEEHYNSSIHFHCLLYWEKDYPIEIIKDLSSHWGKGTVVHKPIKENKDILFIATYLVSGCYDNGKKVNKFDIPKSKKEKAAIKNVRLENVPAYFRCIKHSINMLKPIKEEMLYEDAVRLFGFTEAFDERTLEKETDGFKIKNEYEYYVV